jgi:hypothetical protein
MGKSYLDSLILMEDRTMKNLITLFVAVLFASGVSLASAQNVDSQKPSVSPNDVNSSNLPQKSGSENQTTAHKSNKNATKNMLEKEKNQTSGASPSSK